MPVTVVVGAQFGGEGKGKITSHLCREHDYDVAVRCGGPNSGHTVTIDGEQVVLRQIPAGVLNPRTKLFLSAGCLIDLDVLLEEVERFNLSSERLRIDRNAAIIEEKYRKEEESSGLGSGIGSTCTGTGVAVAKRALRDKDVKLARDVEELKPYLTETSKEIMHSHLNGEKIIIEGTQGFGLSLYHSPYYPYTTSRDTTVSGFLSEVGVSPMAVSDIIMVVRTYPIRVGGNSGPLPNEIDWETIQHESGYPHRIQEMTTVTNKLRRVGRFDLEIVKKASSVNMPTKLALMGLDYIDFKNRSLTEYDTLTKSVKDFINNLEKETGVKTIFLGTGPVDGELVDRIKYEVLL